MNKFKCLFFSGLMAGVAARYDGLCGCDAGLYEWTADVQ